MNVLLSKLPRAHLRGKAPLRLYDMEYCSYCRKVRHEAGKLGVELHVIDVFSDSVERDRLRAATGRTRVPVLGIVDKNGQETFLPESDDIIAYLRDHAAEGN